MQVLKNNPVGEEQMPQNPQWGINTIKNNLKKIMTCNLDKNELKILYHF